MHPVSQDRPLVLREPGRHRFRRQAPPDTGKTVDYLVAENNRSLEWLGILTRMQRGSSSPDQT